MKNRPRVSVCFQSKKLGRKYKHIPGLNTFRWTIHSGATDYGAYVAVAHINVGPSATDSHYHLNRSVNFWNHVMWSTRCRRLFDCDAECQPLCTNPFHSLSYRSTCSLELCIYHAFSHGADIKYATSRTTVSPPPGTISGQNSFTWQTKSTHI